MLFSQSPPGRVYHPPPRHPLFKEGSWLRTSARQVRSHVRPSRIQLKPCPVCQGSGLHSAFCPTITNNPTGTKAFSLQTEPQTCLERGIFLCHGAKPGVVKSKPPAVLKQPCTGSSERMLHEEQRVPCAQSASPSVFVPLPPPPPMHSPTIMHIFRVGEGRER